MRREPFEAMPDGIDAKQLIQALQISKSGRVQPLEQGGLTFEIGKGQLSFRLTAPYVEEWRRAASEQARQKDALSIYGRRSAY